MIAYHPAAAFLWALCHSGMIGAKASTDNNMKTLRIMTFNIWGGGVNENKPINDTVAVIRAANADIVGMQETRAEECSPGVGESAAEAIATALGFYYYEQTHVDYDPLTYAIWDNAIISRHPILHGTKNDTGVKIDAGDGLTVFAFNLHLPDFPYQPYQLLNITYGDAPFLTKGEEAVDAAKQARGNSMEKFYSDLEEVGEDDVVFVVGDFNEPSYLDWTDNAAKAGYHPLKVEFPTSKKLVEEYGFVDALRHVYPDEVGNPAFTWPVEEVLDPKFCPVYHKDRIDFVYVRGTGTNVLDAAVVGEEPSVADIVCSSYRSDHRAVVATVSWEKAEKNSTAIFAAKAGKTSVATYTPMAKATKKMFRPEAKADKTKSIPVAKASKMFKTKEVNVPKDD